MINTVILRAFYLAVAAAALDSVDDKAPFLRRLLQTLIKSEQQLFRLVWATTPNRLITISSILSSSNGPLFPLFLHVFKCFSISSKQQHLPRIVLELISIRDE